MDTVTLKTIHVNSVKNEYILSQNGKKTSKMMQETLRQRRTPTPSLSKINILEKTRTRTCNLYWHILQCYSKYY